MEFAQCGPSPAVIGPTRLHPCQPFAHTMVGWLHAGNESAPAALIYRRTGGRSPFCPDIAAAPPWLGRTRRTSVAAQRFALRILPVRGAVRSTTMAIAETDAQQAT